MDPSIAFLTVALAALVALLPGFIASKFDHRYEVAIWVATIAILAHSLFYLADWYATSNIVVKVRAQDRLWFSTVAWGGVLVWSCMAIETARRTTKSAPSQYIEENNARWAANHGLGREAR